jgi:hypothetical protein
MILLLLHIVFALFYSLTIVCLIRGLIMTAQYYLHRSDTSMAQVAT